MTCALPDITQKELSLNGKTWTVVFYREFEQQIFTTELLDKLTKYTSPRAFKLKFKDFREQVTCRGHFPFDGHFLWTTRDSLLLRSLELGIVFT